jgi:hypothetical protein
LVDQPGYWCDWVPCLTGCCLAYNGHEKFYEATRWIQYLIDHFLKPDAIASRSTLSSFNEFTFDHRADGIVAGCRRDNKQLFLIVVDNNAVRREVLTPADRRFVDEAPLAYESYLDAMEAERPSRRSRLRSVQ